MPRALQVSCARVRFRSFASGWFALLALLPASACLGGPHPLPPEGQAISQDRNSTPTAASNPTPPAQAPAAGSGALTPTAAAGSGATATPGVPAMPGAMMPPAANGGSQPTTPPSTPAGAAGTSSPGHAGAAAPPTQGPTAGAGGAPAQPGQEVCDGPTGALSATDAAPANLLFVLDRSLEMAGDFQGAPRWQMAAQALSHALGSRAEQVTMGALLYPSATSSECSGPDWLCSLQAPAMCMVSEMSAADQVPFQPGSAAMSTLLGDEGLYTAVAVAAGVPLAETLQRADAALAARALPGRTSVVILASGAPTCDWNAAQAGATLARWKTERGVQTHVIALPGSAPGMAQALGALAEAGGTGRVHAPKAVGALEATLQSIVIDSLSSCTLVLDPPATDPSAVRVLVTEDGVERELVRSSATGEAQWTISADGGTVTLLSAACEAARDGTYEAVRVVLGCGRR